MLLLKRCRRRCPTADLLLPPLLQIRLHDQLQEAGLPAKLARAAALLRGLAAGREGPPRLALNSKEQIAWVNDLEKDPQYASWPSSLQALLMPMFPGEV